MIKMIFDAASALKAGILTDRFRAIYENGFPDKNEREEFDTILDRVHGKKSSLEPNTILLFYLIEGEGSAVGGGLIADWYAHSNSIHLTYLIVDEKFRKMGIARELIQEGIPMIKSHIREAHGVGIRNVFFESNNPALTRLDNFDSVHRLEIFSRYGGKLVNIPYVQPALDAEKKVVKNLFLLSFSQFNALNDRIPAVEIIDFLKDLYLGLGCGEQDKNLSAMEAVLNELKDGEGNVMLEDIRESSRFHIPNATVTWHFMGVGEPVAASNQKNPEPRCNYFTSFETDLLNFQNQKMERPPFSSEFICRIGNVAVVFPGFYQYHSEGVLHYRMTEKGRSEIPAILAISRTRIGSQGMFMYHLTIAPARDQFFTEHDLVKCSTLFGSTQEKSGSKGNPEPRIRDNGTDHSLKEFLRSRCRIPGGTVLRNLKTGIVQMEDSFPGREEKNFPDHFFEALSGDVPSAEGEIIHSFSKALCGIILGIHDFDRMGSEEIADTLKPVVTGGTSFIMMCRGALLKISKKDDMMEATSRHILVDPYLLVPNMVLATNEYLLSLAAGELNAALTPGANVSQGAMERCQKNVLHIQNFRYIKNVFQYRSELALLESGNRQRGITNLEQEIKGKLEDLSRLIALKRADKGNKAEGFMGAFLGFIAMYALNPVLIKYVGSEQNEIYLILLEVVLSAGIYLLVRAKK